VKFLGLRWAGSKNMQNFGLERLWKHLFRRTKSLWEGTADSREASCNAGLMNLWRAYPKRHAERFPWQAAFTAVPIFSFARPASLCCEEYVHIHIYIWLHRDCVATKQYWEWNIFPQIGSCAKCWLDIYRWSAGLAVIGWIRDIGQKVLQSSV
jgi:hypothetical protein